MRGFWVLYTVFTALIVLSGLALAQRSEGLGMPFVMIASTALVFVAVAFRTQRR